MTTDELRAAAERLRADFAAGTRVADMRVVHVPSGHLNDLRRIAQAYLAEHPADEDVVADGQWLQAIGAIRLQQAAAGSRLAFGPAVPQGYAGTVIYAVTFEFERRAGGVLHITVGGYREMIVTGYTRGQVRRLLAAVGVAYTESTHESAVTP